MSTQRETRTTCEALAATIASAAAVPMAYTWGDRSSGALLISDESGVKRVRCYVAPDEHGNGWGEHDIGPGFLTWRELAGFLRGMREALWLVRDGEWTTQR